MVAILCTRLTKIVTTLHNYIIEQSCNRKQSKVCNEMEIPEAQYNFANFENHLLVKINFFELSLTVVIILCIHLVTVTQTHAVTVIYIIMFVMQCIQ